MRCTGVETVFHYIDDFLLLGTPHCPQCAVDLVRLQQTFGWLRIPLAPEKREGPATCVTFLGIELDSELMVARLPLHKIAELHCLLTQWQGRRCCLVKELQSLVGKLQHAGKVIRPGRTFLRHMLGLLKGIPRHQKFIRLNTAFRSDLTWWLVFMETWNGISMFPTEAHTQPDYHLFTDASGRLGCGAWADRS